MSVSGSGSTWPHQKRFPIEYHHLDILGHLNHAAYFPFMETLRCEYYLPIIGSSDPATLDIIIAEATCQYLAPVHYGMVLSGEVAPSKPLGKTSFTLLYRFTDPERRTVYARGKTVVVCYDYSHRVKKEIPPERRAIMERDAVSPKAEGWP